MVEPVDQTSSTKSGGENDKKYKWRKQNSKSQPIQKGAKRMDCKNPTHHQGVES